MTALDVDGRTASIVKGAVVAVICLALAASAWTASTWAPALRSALGVAPPTPEQSVEQWITANVDRAATLLVDADAGGDLAGDGWPAAGLVPADRVGEPLGSLEVTAWSGYDYVVSTPASRAAAASTPALASALTSSTVVIAFGAGDDRAELREIDPAGLAAADRATQQQMLLSRAMGREMATSPRLVLRPAAARALVSGAVDERLMSALVGLAGQHPITVADVTDPDPGDGAPTHFLEAIVDTVDPVRGVDGAQQASVAAAWLLAQAPAYRPDDVSVHDGRLWIRYRLPLPPRDGG
jgi:hypothetical protein